MLLRFFVCITICLASTYSILNTQQIASISTQDILAQPYIKVLGSASTNDNYIKGYFVLKVGSKSKNQAYNQINYRFKKICNFLKSIHMIPDQTSLIASEVQVMYQNKRRSWIFSRFLLLYGSKDDMDSASEYLLKNYCIKAQYQSWVPHFIQKLKILRSFINAKNKLLALLENKDIRIKQLQYYMINSYKYKTSKDILDKFTQQDDDSDSQDNNSSENENSSCQQDSFSQQAICSSWLILKQLIDILPKQNTFENIEFIFKLSAKKYDEEQHQQGHQ